MRVLSVHIYKKPVSGPIASERPISTATAGPICACTEGRTRPSTPYPCEFYEIWSHVEAQAVANQTAQTRRPPASRALCSSRDVNEQFVGA